jgi:hypothetical protein
MTGQKITTSGKKLILNRTFKSTPDYTAPSVFSVGTGTTDPVVGNTTMEAPVSIDGDNFKAFVSGYPSLNETTLQSTIRCFINSLEANGNDLTEFGILNSDGTKILFSRAVFTALSKTSSTEVTFIVKDKII